MSPASYLARLESDFDAVFRLPKIAPPDPIDSLEASEGMCGLPECGCGESCEMCGEVCDG